MGCIIILAFPELFVLKWDMMYFYTLNAHMDVLLYS
jgi:hypothetical protein